MRELERRWRTTRAVEDEVALLQERARAGLLTLERLRVAAACGHAAAAILCGPGRQGLLGRVADAVRRAWSGDALSTRLIACSEEGSRRAALAFCETALESEQEWPDDLRAHAAACVRGLEAWLDGPCEAHAEAARTARRSVEEHVESVADVPIVRGPHEPRALAQWAHCAASAAWTIDSVRALVDCEEAAIADRMLRYPDEARAEAGRVVRRAVSARVVAWALGAEHATAGSGPGSG